MMYYNKIDIEIDVKKTNESKECDFCHSGRFKFQTYVCNGCHDLLMTYTDLNHIAILNINGIDYYYIISGINKSEVVNLLENADLT